MSDFEPPLNFSYLRDTTQYNSYSIRVDGSEEGSSRVVRSEGYDYLGSEAAHDRFTAAHQAVIRDDRGNPINEYHDLSDFKYMFAPKGDSTRLVIALNDDQFTGFGTSVSNGFLLKLEDDGSFSLYTLKQNRVNGWNDGVGHREQPEAIIEDLLNLDKVDLVYNSGGAALPEHVTNEESQEAIKSLINYFINHLNKEGYDSSGVHFNLDYSWRHTEGIERFLGNYFARLYHDIKTSDDPNIVDAAQKRLLDISEMLISEIGYDKTEDIFERGTGYNNLLHTLRLRAIDHEELPADATDLQRLQAIERSFKKVYDLASKSSDKAEFRDHYADAYARAVTDEFYAEENFFIKRNKYHETHERLKNYITGANSVNTFMDNDMEEFLTQYKREALNNGIDGFSVLTPRSETRDALKELFPNIDDNSKFFTANDGKSILILNPTASGIQGHRLSISDDGLQYSSFNEAKISELSQFKNESFWKDARTNDIEFGENTKHILGLLTSETQKAAYVKSEVDFDQRELSADNQKIRNLEAAIEALEGFDPSDTRTITGIRNTLDTKLAGFSDLSTLVSLIPSGSFQVKNDTNEKVVNLKQKATELKDKLISDNLDEIKSKLDTATHYGVDADVKDEIIAAIKILTEGLDQAQVESLLNAKGFPTSIIDALKEDTASTITPSTTGADPSTTGADPSTTGTDPSTTGADPSTTGTDPSTTGADPSTTGADPSTTGADPSTAIPGTDPSTTGTDPSTTASTGDANSKTSRGIIDLLQLPFLDNQDKETVLYVLNQKLNGHNPDQGQLKTLQYLLTEKYKTVPYADLKLSDFFNSNEAINLAQRVTHENSKIRDIAAAIPFETDLTISQLRSTVVSGTYPPGINQHTNTIIAKLKEAGLEPNPENINAVKMAILFNNEDEQNTVDTTELGNPFDEFSVEGINIQSLTDEQLASFITEFEKKDFTNNPASLLRQRAILDLLKDNPEFREAVIALTQEPDQGQKVVKLQQLVAGLLDRSKQTSQLPGFYQLDSSMRPVGALKSFTLSGDVINTKFSALQFKKDGQTGLVKFVGDKDQLDEDFLRLFTPIYGENFDSIEDIVNFYNRNPQAFANAFVQGTDGNSYFNAQTRTKFSQGASFFVQNYINSLSGAELSQKDERLAKDYIGQLRQVFGEDLKTVSYSGQELANPNARVLVSQNEVYNSLLTLLKELSEVSKKPASNSGASLSTKNDDELVVALNLPSLNGQYVSSDYSWTQQPSVSVPKQEQVEFNLAV